MSKERRLGKFYLSGNIMNDPLPYQKIFSGMVVLRAEYDAILDRAEYIAASEHFEPIPDGAMIPEYLCELTAEDGRIIKWRWFPVFQG